MVLTFSDNGELLAENFVVLSRLYGMYEVEMFCYQPRGNERIIFLRQSLKTPNFVQQLYDLK